MRFIRFIALGIASFIAITITPLAVGKVPANWQPQYLAANIIPNQFSVNTNAPNVTLPTIQSQLQAQNSGTGKFCNFHPPNGGWLFWYSENSTDPCEYGRQQCPDCRLVSQGTYSLSNQNQISLTCSGFSQTFQGMGREPLANALEIASNRQLNACIFTVGALPAPPQNIPNNSSSSSTASSIPQEMVNAHNQWRSKLGLPPLRWSDEVANYAQQWANQLASTGSFQHRTEHRYGENLFMGSGRQFSPTEVVDDWGSEVTYYDYATNSCRPGEMCGHYTQVVWRDTTEIGCAVARSGNREVWVCNYNPPGNYRGQKPY
jgi:uncharacterized protein YkwD